MSENSWHQPNSRPPCWPPDAHMVSQLMWNSRGFKPSIISLCVAHLVIYWRQTQHPVVRVERRPTTCPVARLAGCWVLRSHGAHRARWNKSRRRGRLRSACSTKARGKERTFPAPTLASFEPPLSLRQADIAEQTSSSVVMARFTKHIQKKLSTESSITSIDSFHVQDTYGTCCWEGRKKAGARVQKTSRGAGVDIHVVLFCSSFVVPMWSIFIYDYASTIPTHRPQTF